MKSNVLLTLAIFCFGAAFSQTVLNTISSESFDALKNTYNYTYWDQSWKNSVTGARSFTNHTSSFAMNVNYNTLNFNSLQIVAPGKTPDLGYSELHSVTFENQYAGELKYAVLQNGQEFAIKPEGASAVFDSENAEFGTWCNKRFVSTLFDKADFYTPYFTGIEFVNWHDRFRLTFHLKPAQDIENGQLKFEIDIPSQYSQKKQSGDVYGFSDGEGKGFAVKGDSGVQDVTVTGNKITVVSTTEDFVTDSSYRVGLIFYAIHQDFDNSYSTIFTKDAGPIVFKNGAVMNYDKDDGVHMINVPNVSLGYKNCANVNNRVLQNIVIENKSSQEKKARLCFWRQGGADITGYNSLFIDKQGNPTGFPIQTSKNWHGGATKFFSGLYIRDYTELIIPPETTMNLEYIKTGGKWGTVYGVSSDQLALSNKAGWLEASIGGFGENLTHSTDYVFGNTMAADVRPFLVNASINHSGLFGNECDWTGNVGGMDMWCYINQEGKRLYHQEPKVRFKKYSPNLTETSLSALSGDQKMKLDYTFYLNRSDDAMRVYYKVKMKALSAVSFDRFDFFQLGGDTYNHASARSYAYGNVDGLTTLASPDCSSADAMGFTTSEIALPGNSPWVWAGDPVMVGGKTQHRYPGNRGMIIRDYTARINGVENNIPYFRERCKSDNQSPSYSLVPPPGVHTFSKDDEVEFTVEVIILPNQDGDYYGPNTNFAAALKKYGNSWELLYREAAKNQIIATSPTNVMDTSYPLTVATVANTALVTITGGAGYIPLVFKGLTKITDPKLWKAYDDCWEIVDQSYHGKDFWQTDYDPETETFELTYNVNQDIESDETAIIQYYLGSEPPSAAIVRQSKVGDNSWTAKAEILAKANIDDVRLAPQFMQHGSTSPALSNNYTWAGPNNFEYTGRVLDFFPITHDDQGEYTVTYTNEFGCSYTKMITLTVDTNLSVEKNEVAPINFYPNPVTGVFRVSENSTKTVIYNIAGQEVYRSNQPSTQFDVAHLRAGLYFVKFELETHKISTKFFVKH